MYTFKNSKKFNSFSKEYTITNETVISLRRFQQTGYQFLFNMKLVLSIGIEIKLKNEAIEKILAYLPASTHSSPKTNGNSSGENKYTIKYTGIPT